MLSTSVAITGPTSVGSSQYTANLYFSNSTRAKFLNISDIVRDSTGNEYEVVTWVAYPTDFSSGGSVTLLAITSDVLPVVDGGYNSTCYTPNQKSVTPVVQTKGTIGSIALYSGQNYEYSMSASWDNSANAALAEVGDIISDNVGHVYRITYLDATKFSTTFRVTEVDKTATAPTAGVASLFRPTSNKSMSQCVGLSTTAMLTLFNRDSFIVDDYTVENGKIASNLDIDSGETEEVDRIAMSTGYAVKWQYVVVNGDNSRTGTINASWVNNQVVAEAVESQDVGDTSGITLSVAADGTDVVLSASVATAENGGIDDWKVVARRELVV